MRQAVLSRVAELLNGISVANGYNTDPSLVQYGDGTPSEYDQPGIEISYLIPSRTLAISNKRWDWTGILQVVATLYGDVDGANELLIEADIFRALGSDQALGRVAQFNWPSGMEFTTDRVVAGKHITMLTLSFPIRYSTEMWVS